MKSQGPGFDGDTKGLAEGVLGGAQPGSATGLGCSPVLCVIPSLPAQALGAEAAGTTSSAGCVYTCGEVDAARRAGSCLEDSCCVKSKRTWCHQEEHSLLPGLSQLSLPDPTDTVEQGPGRKERSGRRGGSV